MFYKEYQDTHSVQSEVLVDLVEQYSIVQYGGHSVY